MPQRTCFFVIANQGRAMISVANIPRDLRQTLWREAFKAATLLYGLAIMNVDGIYKTRYKHWGVEAPNFVKYLHTWEEAGIVKIQASTTPMIYDHGQLCMFLGRKLKQAGNRL
jgi:hypothetical protein